MKAINAGKVLEKLDGASLQDPNDPTKTLTLGKALSMILINHKGKKFDNFKLWDLSKKFYDDCKNEIEVDDSDFAIIKEIVGEDGNFNALVLGQIAAEFSNLK